MDRVVRLSPSEAQAQASSFLTGEDLYELLQGRFCSGANTGGVNSLPSPTLVPSLPASILKMEPEITSDPFLSNSYNNWIPNPGYADTLGACGLYSSHLTQPLDSHFGYTKPAAACQSPGQIQALREFMAHGTMSSQSPIINPSAHSRASSMAFYQHDDSIGAETMVATAGDYAAHMSDHQSEQEMLAYRSLCSEIYATERSPHRSQFQRENHILAERQRREEMNEKFSALRAMIPKATKKDKASIVGDTINYVLELEKRLKHLQGCKDIEGGSSFFKSSKRKVAPLTAPYSSSNNMFEDTSGRPIHAAQTNNVAQTPEKPVCNDQLLQQLHVETSRPRDISVISTPSDQLTGESKSEEKKSAEVDVQKLGNQAVIKLVCSRTPGQVLRVLHALDECKVDLLQSNVTTVGDISVHFVTVQLEAGVSVTTEELISALLLATCPN